MKMSLRLSAFALVMLIALGTCHPIQNDASKDANELTASDDDVIEKATEEDKSEEGHFPDRRGFVTGHRIPLELFSEDTLRRIELLEDEDSQDDYDEDTSRVSYVDSDDIRRPEVASFTVRRPLISPVGSLIPRPEYSLLGAAAGLSREADTKYFDSLTSIVPLDYF